MDHITRLSEVVYVGLCRKIGTPTEVVIRRDVMDIKEMIENPVNIRRRYGEMMKSGSNREGFRLKSSDIDMMVWFCDHRLITDISQSRIYNTSKHDIILMEDIDTPPGFARLRPLTSSQDRFITSTSVEFNGRVFISCFLWRELVFQSVAKHELFQQINISTHGPCLSGFEGPTEFDQVICFASIHWPKLMTAWVDRCQRNIWPPVPVLEKILRNGFHCVPIGSNIVSNSNELEWRLSFSKAEQQLVCTMNHTQFLCYGLLKIFLKEVINKKKEPLLCSYYMKTTMFWMIQLGHLIWLPNRLLDCFWECFRYLIHCVYRGDFPNFFIPKNNMFINKIVSVARESLLQQLYQYYRMGVSCLLLSPSLRSILEPALSSPSFVLSSAEGEFISIADIDVCGRKEIFSFAFNSEPEILDFYLYLKSNDTLSSFSCSSYQLLTIQYVKSETLVHIAFTIANNNSYWKHKNIYFLDRVICNMLKLAVMVGPVSYSLFLALYYYRTAKYDKTLHIIHLSKQKLSQDFIMNLYTVDEQRYNEAVGNLPSFRRMKIAWVKDINLCNNIVYIEELCLEQNLSLQNGYFNLFLPPLVLIEMLSVLSYYRLGNRSQCLQSLTELQALLIYDDETYVPLPYRDISWQILGICQHVVGDLHGALRSFEESLRQDPQHKIQEATLIRIECVKEQQRNMQA